MPEPPNTLTENPTLFPTTGDVVEALRSALSPELKVASMVEDPWMVKVAGLLVDENVPLHPLKTSFASGTPVSVMVSPEGTRTSFDCDSATYPVVEP